jgi:molecular chaperone GrpE
MNESRRPHDPEHPQSPRHRPHGNGRVGEGGEAPDRHTAPGDAGSEAQAASDPGERYLRLAADFENYKRRQAQELANRSRFASEDAARAMIPVLDNLRRALEHAPEEGAGSNLLGGLRMVMQQFEAALADLGVTRVDSVGTRFDPSQHEAIGGEESDEVTEDTVVTELQPGYRLHERLLRPALVRVAHPRRHTAAGSGD